MRIVVADTGPLNYLTLIGHINLLPALFEKVLIPATVRNELTSIHAPPAVLRWMAAPPDWLEIREDPIDQAADVVLEGLDAGEKAAIQLAASVGADLVLMDDRKGAMAAKRKGLLVTGTLGVLDLAAGRGLLDFAQAIGQLEQTNFRRPAKLLESLLAKHKDRRP